jgi:hypothetical protein
MSTTTLSMDASVISSQHRYHSTLDGNKGDSMILGAASNEQLAEAMTVTRLSFSQELLTS